MSTRMIMGVTVDQWSALEAEATSIRNHLAYGIRALRTAEFIDTTLEPIYSILSIGLEKLLKVSLGLIEIDSGRAFPTAKTMKSTWGHDVEKLFDRTMRELRNRAPAKNDFVRGAIFRADNDPVAPSVINALSLYGIRGRFHNLDVLGGGQGTGDSLDTWMKIEQATLNDPTVAELRDRVQINRGNNTMMNDLMRGINCRAAEVLESIWNMIVVAGDHMLLGELGKSFGVWVAPNSVGRQ